MMRRKYAVVALSTVLLLANPFVGTPTVRAQSWPTLSEYYHAADVVLVGRRAFVEPTVATARDAVAETVRVLRDRTDSYSPGTRVSVPDGLPSTPDRLVLLFGYKAGNAAYQDLVQRVCWCGTCFRRGGEKPVYEGVRWESRDITPAVVEYIMGSPPSTVAVDKRLEYFAKFLETDDTAVSADAFAEFANAIEDPTFRPPAALRPDQIRRWLLNPKTPVQRQAVYGLMLGMCGGPDDADVLERMITDVDDERRFGIDGVMGGYLWLKGESGLKFLESAKLADPEAPAEEIYSVVLAIRYLRRHGNGKIAPERLNAAMRLLLNKPDFTHTVVSDLARAKDWSLHERLKRLYGALGDDATPEKRAIIMYMIASTRDIAKDANELPEHARAGRECLTEIRHRDPKLVAEVEKYFLLP